MDLNYKRKSHRKTFIKILYIVDPEKNNTIFKDRIMEFFASSGFQIIAQLHREQQKLNIEEVTMKDNLIKTEILDTATNQSVLIVNENLDTTTDNNQ